MLAVLGELWASRLSLVSIASIIEPKSSSGLFNTRQLMDNKEMWKTVYTRNMSSEDVLGPQQQHLLVHLKLFHSIVFTVKYDEH